LLTKKHHIGVQLDDKIIIKGMEGKKRDRPPFYNQVFMQLIDDYKQKNDKSDLSLNMLKAFKQLEAAEVDPSLLAYSIILNKDSDQYQPYTPQHKIGKSLNKKSAGTIIKYYKTGQQEDGYKGYSTNYQDLNIDIYKQELWNIVKDILRLEGYDIQKLEDQIFCPDFTGYDVMFPTNRNPSLVDKQHRKSSNTCKNIEINESLAKDQASQFPLVICM
jgi:DNA polymerase elongation subunit (family B)